MGKIKKFIKNIFADKQNHHYASEALELTLDNLDTLIYINEIDTGKILFINKKMAKEFGGDVQRFMGHPCWKVLQDNFDEMCPFCPTPHLLKTGEPFRVWEEYNTVTHRYYQNTDSLIKWVNGKTVHMQHSVDITERKKHEMEMAEVLSRLEAIMANYSGILISLDMNKNCTMASGSRISHLGINKEDMVGRNIYDIMPSHKEELEPILDDAYRGTPSNWVMKIGIGDYSCFQTTLYDSKKQIIGVLFAANDISSSIKIQTELQEAMELAKKSSKAKSEFLSKMSNEIRTPMNTIIGMTQVAKETDDLKQISDCINSIDTAAHNLLELINDGVNISRIEVEKKTSELDLSKLNVLLVEDIKVNQDVFKALLKKTNINVDTADNGVEAITKFKENSDKYDIIFMDIQMPEMDGYEASRKIRAMEDIPNSKTIPIIAMTANVFKEDIEKSLESGMNDHLGKPINRDNVVEKIKAYVASKG